VLGLGEGMGFPLMMMNAAARQIVGRIVVIIHVNVPEDGPGGSLGSD